MGGYVKGDRNPLCYLWTLLFGAEVLLLDLFVSHGFIFFISGYTFNAGLSYISFLIKKLRTIVLPYACFAVVTILYDQLQAIVHAHDYDIVNVLLKYVLQQRYTVLWFMTCLYLSE